MKPILYVGNRNYSSWSLRAYLVLAWSKLEFETRVIPLGEPGFSQRRSPSLLAVSATGTVPVLHVGTEVIADSLAIAEWAAEQVPELWPRSAAARAQARSAVCEMHASFGALRSALPCNLRRSAPARLLAADVLVDVARIEAIWADLQARFASGAPLLFGEAPTIPDAFFAPVATRFRSYGVPISPAARRYTDAILADPSYLAWEQAAREEPWTLPQTDAV